MLIAHAMPIGYFPSTWYIACCSSPGRNQCWADSSCLSERLPTDRCVRPHELWGGANGSWPPWATSWVARDSSGCVRAATGKYRGVEGAVLHSSLMRCGAARWRVQRTHSALPSKALRVADGLKSPADWVRRREHYNWSLQQGSVHLQVPVRVLEGARHEPFAAHFKSPLVEAVQPDLAAASQSEVGQLAAGNHLACPLQLAELPLSNGSRRGVCEATDFGESNCDVDSMGSWNTAEYSIGGFHECVHRCRKCRRCHFVSFSALGHDCSWYNTCDLDNLKMNLEGMSPDFVTARVHHRDR